MRSNATYGAIGNKLKNKGDVRDWNYLKTLIESATKTSKVSTLTPPKTFISFKNCTKRIRIFPNWRIENYYRFK